MVVDDFDDDDDRPTFPDDLAAQHKHLQSLIGGLLERAERGASGGEMRKLLDALSADVADHFSAEEHVMERGRYPHLDLHREHHEKFLSHLETLARECSQRETGLHRSIVQQLEDWYHDHMHTADAEALKFLGLGK